MKAGPGRPKGPKRRRVQVTLSEENWRLVERIAEKKGVGKATLLAEIYESVIPALDLTMKALELAEESPREAQRLVTNYGAEVVMQLQQEHLAFDEVVTKKLGGAKRGRTP